MKVLVGEYVVECALGGVFEEIDECESREEMLMRAQERLANELADLVLKRPSELMGFFSIRLEDVEEVEVEE